MSGGSVSISYGEGVHDWGIQDLQLALSTLRRFLATADRFKLLPSEINFVRVNTIFHDEIRQEDLTETSPGLENQPPILLPTFERDLVSLHLLKPAYEDECGHHSEAVWTTTRAMRLFRPLLDLAWTLSREYNRPGDHRALDEG